MGFKSSLYKKYSVVFIVSVVVVTSFVIIFERQIMLNNLSQKAEAITSILSTVTADSILTYDYVSLERYTKELIKNKDFIEFTIKKNNNDIIIQSEKKTDEKGYLIVKEVKLAEETIGFIEIRFSTKTVNSMTLRIIVLATFFTILIHLLGLLINNRIIDFLIFTPISKLVDATKEIKKGNFDYKIEISGNNEFATLSQEMIDMAQTIKNNLNEIKEKNRELEITKKQIEAIIDNIADGLFITDNNDKIVFFNETAEKITANNKNEIIGKLCRDVFRDSFCEKICNLKTLQETKNIEVTFNTMNSSKILMASTSYLELYDDKLFSIVTFKDVTKNKEEQAMIFHTEKLAAMGAMSSAIAHELNNPLANIVGYVKLILNHLKVKSENINLTELEEKLKTIHDQASKAAGIVQEVLNFSRYSSDRINKFLLNDTIQNIINVASLYSHQKNIEISFIKKTQDIVVTKIDKQKLEQMLYNIIVNAIHAANNNGKIIITSKCYDDCICISIEDNGCGIPEENLNKIFDPFFTTKPSGKGTGLGLFVVRKIADEINAEIKVESVVNVGTKFDVKIKNKA